MGCHIFNYIKTIFSRKKAPKSADDVALAQEKKTDSRPKRSEPTLSTPAERGRKSRKKQDRVPSHVLHKK